MDFSLNGERKTFDGDPEMSLLTYLREIEGVTSLKNGCAPQAACGACTADLNGKAVLSCVIPMKNVQGGQVTTLEGIGDYRREVFSQAFVSKGGVQCGFCIPGIVMRANTLINQNPDLTLQDIEQNLTPNLCRCTGYKKVIESIQLAVDTIWREENLSPEPVKAGVGERASKYQGKNLVLGQHEYVDDIRIPGLVFGALKFSDHPRAIVKKIDVKKAERLDGVIRVVTWKDIPGDRMIGLIRQDWPLMVADGEYTRYVGDVLAGVVAESEDIARQGVELIEVEFEVDQPVTDMHAALEPNAPAIHADGNVLSKTIIRRGDLEKQKDESSFTSQGVYETQMIEHGFMEPEASIAVMEDDQLKIYSQGQGIYEDRVQIAKLLGLSGHEVNVVMVPNGGGFGGKEDLSVQGHSALMSYLVNKPVKLRLTRDESIRMHPKRHPFWMDYAVGCDSTGKLTFVRARILGDTGAYASVGMKVLERAAGHATGAYHIPVVDIESTAVYTNNIPCGAMRGFGVNQVIFALESCIDDLCEQGGFDRWQFRYDNALTDGNMISTGQVLEGGVGIRETLLAVKNQFYTAKYTGLACGLKNTGIGNGMTDAASVRITIEAEDRVVIDHGWTEMGQGVNTIAIQTVVTETGIDPAIIEVRIDTTAEVIAGMTTASRATSLVGNALIDACKRLREDLQTHTLSELVGNRYDGRWIVDWTTKPGQENKEIHTHYSYSYASQLVILDDDGQITKVVAAHDAGKIFNPTMFEGQIEGSIHMGLGYALTEELVLIDGVPKSTHLRQIGILRAKEMPEVEVIGVEVPDPYGPYGAKGVGEIGLVPTAAAVANAFYQFDEVRRTKLPMGRIRKRRR